MNKRKVIVSLALFLFVHCPLSDAADPTPQVVAVLSSDAPPYQEALSGLQETYGQPVSVVMLSREEFRAPRSGSIVVAFGAKAALQTASSYEGTVIYGVSPGTKVPVGQHSGSLVHIHTSPAALTVVQQYKQLQPSLRRLAILWIGDAIADYVEQKNQIASAQGVELISVRLKNLDELPSRLRSLQGKIDAIWMPPDAALITPQSFAAVREFCIAQRIPFYVPSDGLVDKGATASVYTSFRELGRLAGSMAKKASEGTLGTDHSIFPSAISLTLNASAASQCGLKIPQEVLRKADRVVP